MRELSSGHTCNHSGGKMVQNTESVINQRPIQQTTGQPISHFTVAKTIHKVSIFTTNNACLSETSSVMPGTQELTRSAVELSSLYGGRQIL